MEKMLVNVTVESNFSGPAKGYLKITVDDSQSVQILINKFCESKGINVEPHYKLITQANIPLSGTKLIKYYNVRDGDKLFLGNSGDYKRFRFTNWFAVSALAIFLGISGIAICVSVYLLLRDIPESYAIVFDAGSTHTDTILFKWPGSKINNTGLVTEVHECYTVGGIDSISPVGNNIFNYLNNCLEEAKRNIHPDSSKYTEVFFGATAGMRLLKEVNETKAAETMAGVLEFLHSSGLEFDDSQSQIIPGDIEGVNGWITVNYLNRSLQSPNKEKTRGALDLGGASTQISFEVDNKIDIDNPHVKEVNLYGKEFHIFSQSFLCYGTVQALLRYRAFLIKQHLEATRFAANITSPCDPIGLETQVLESSIISSPCTPNSLSILQHLNQRKNNETFLFVGTSDYNHCSSIIQYLLSIKFCKDMLIDNDKCLDASNIPRGFQSKSFTGFSGFAYARQNLNFSNTATKDEFMTKTSSHCNLTLDEIIQVVLKDKNKKLKNLQELCFKAVFIHTLLGEVYKFENNTLWSNIEFGNEIQNKTLGWALGYMVNATESIKTVPSIPTFDTIAFSLLLVLFCIFLLLGAAFCFKAIKFRQPDRYNQVNARPILSNC